jgi:hypothetical protein
VKLDVGAGNRTRQERINTACPSRPSADATVPCWLLRGPWTGSTSTLSTVADFSDLRFGVCRMSSNENRMSSDSDRSYDINMVCSANNIGLWLPEVRHAAVNIRLQGSAVLVVRV